MKSRHHRRPFSLMSARAPKTRRGSVLIFVVAILVLLALTGIAYVATTGMDRTTTRQNEFNTQVDLMLKSAIEMAKGTIASGAHVNSTADQFDALTGMNSPYLGSRVPRPYNPNVAVDGPASDNATSPSVPKSIPKTNPVLWPMMTPSLNNSPFVDVFSGLTYSARANVAPGFIVVNDTTYPAVCFDTDNNFTNGFEFRVPGSDTDMDGIVDAALVPMGVGPVNGLTYYYAARIVDLNSALNVNTAFNWNDPAAVKIGAGLSSPIVAPAATPANSFANLSPGFVELELALSGNAAQRSAQMTRLQSLRNANAGNYSLDLCDDNGVVSATTYYQTAQDAYYSQAGRRPENLGYRTTGSKYDAFSLLDSAKLARGFVLRDDSMTPSGVESILYESTLASAPGIPYGPSDATTWYNRNFDVPATAAIATDTPPNTNTASRRALLTATNPVGSDAIANTVFQSRSDGDVTEWKNSTTYNFGDVVTFKFGTYSTRTYLCLQTHTSVETGANRNRPGTAAGLQYWSLLSWNIQPQKIDVNNADFGELWWGFRRVLSRIPVLPNSATAAQKQTYETVLKRVAEAPYVETAGTRAGLGKRMFRNPIRDPNAFGPTPLNSRHLTGSEVLQVRAALAAVNAMALRDNSDNVIARRLFTDDFGNYSAAPANYLHEVTVFGTERQPYITEVYVNNDIVATAGDDGSAANPKGYVAVELYNPYPVPMVLEGWALGRIKRPPVTSTTAAVPLTCQVLHPSRFDASIVIPAEGFLILENYDKSGTSAVPDVAKHRPAEMHLELSPPAPPTGWIPAKQSVPLTTAIPTTGERYFAYVENLEAVLEPAGGSTQTVPTEPGGELVILRPRIWSMPDRALPRSGSYFDYTNPTSSYAKPAEDPCDEGANVTLTPAILADLVPVDSYDFTGIALAADPLQPGDSYKYWHYARSKEDLTLNTAWRWVLGLPSQLGSAALTQQSAAPQTASGNDPTLTPPTLSFGAHGTGTFAPAQAAGVQLQAVDWPNPNRAVTPTSTNGTASPYGLFARLTDLFTVPYIGAYRVKSNGSDTNVGEFTELNSISIDMAFADDEDIANDAVEQVGRFCTLSTLAPLGYRTWNPPTTTIPIPASGTLVDWYDFSTNIDETGGTYQQTVRHGLLDLFATANPMTDFMGGAANPERAVFSSDPLHRPMSVTSSTEIPPAATYAWVVAGNNSSITLYNTPTTQINSQLKYFGASSPKFRGVVEILAGPQRGATAVLSAEPAAAITLAADGVNSKNSLTAGSIMPTAPTAPTSGDLHLVPVRILGKPEEATGINGLININTAPWYVLARLPMVLAANGTVDQAANDALAKQIVAWRETAPRPLGDASGPFHSILDLNRVLDQPSSNPAPTLDSAVPAFQTRASGTELTADINNLAGDLTPIASATTPSDHVIGDFEARYNTLGRICNMITTRSDSFVVYIDVQGWRNANTAKAEMVVQRRAAMIIDRSAYNLQSKSLNTTTVPMRSAN